MIVGGTLSPILVHFPPTANEPTPAIPVLVWVYGAGVVAADGPVGLGVQSDPS